MFVEINIDAIFIQNAEFLINIQNFFMQFSKKCTHIYENYSNGDFSIYMISIMGVSKSSSTN